MHRKPHGERLTATRRTPGPDHLRRGRTPDLASPSGAECWAQATDDARTPARSSRRYTPEEEGRVRAARIAELEADDRDRRRYQSDKDRKRDQFWAATRSQFPDLFPAPDPPDPELYDWQGVETEAAMAEVEQLSEWLR